MILNPDTLLRCLDRANARRVGILIKVLQDRRGGGRLPTNPEVMSRFQVSAATAKRDRAIVRDALTATGVEGVEVWP